MEEKIEDNLETKIQCEKHGRCSVVDFTYNEELIKRVCFLCYGDKVTDGLTNYK